MENRFVKLSQKNYDGGAETTLSAMARNYGQFIVLTRMSDSNAKTMIIDRREAIALKRLLERVYGTH